MINCNFKRVDVQILYITRMYTFYQLSYPLKLKNILSFTALIMQMPMDKTNQYPPNLLYLSISTDECSCHL